MNEPKINILDLVAALNAGKRLVLNGTLIVCLLAGVASMFLPNEFEATVQLLPPKEQKKGFGFSDLLADLPIPSLKLGAKGTPADIFVAILKSPTLRRSMANHFDLMKAYELESMSDAIEGLKSKTEVGKSEEGTILISVLDQDPVKAAKMANHYVILLDSTNQALSRETARERYEFIALLEKRETVTLNKAMVRLQRFQEDHNAISITEQARAVIRASADLQMATMELEIKKQGLLRSGFAPSHPDVQRLEHEGIMRQEGLKYLRDGEKPLDGSTPLLRLKENLFLPLRKIPETAQQYSNIEKDVLVQGALMKMLLEQKAEALIEAANIVSTIQVLDAATTPEKKTRPKRMLIVFVAGVLSLFASTFYILAAAYVRELSSRWRADYSSKQATTR
jgi:tyrosine-protein kinase Etk/Wzc